MIPLGLTQNTAAKERTKLFMRIRIIRILFFLCCLLPIVSIVLIGAKVIPTKSVIGDAMETAVAKVITSSSSGTAFLVSPTTLLTARHVVESVPIGESVQIIFEKMDPPIQVNAKVLFYKPESITPLSSTVSLDYFLTDIAILQIEEIEDITPLPCGDSDLVQELDEIILIGYPEGDYSKTHGNINSTEFETLDLFKSDVTANPGNSGGPCILKDDNSVIGFAVGSRGAEFQGENIILKINSIRNFLISKGVEVTF